MWKTLIVEYRSEEEAKALRSDWRPFGFLSRDEPDPDPDEPFLQRTKPVFYVLLGKEESSSEEQAECVVCEGPTKNTAVTCSLSGNPCWCCDSCRARCVSTRDAKNKASEK